VYWRYTDQPLDVVEIEQQKYLPSSSFYRKEIQLIQERKFKDADKIVEALEKAEDKDHYNRETAKKPKKKGWFG
jgi:hypothetical protein